MQQRRRARHGSWIWEQTLENWNATIAIDVTAAMLCTREVLNQSMLERRSGVILNFSSTAGYNGMVRKSHYVTAKASLRAFTKAVALEVGQYGIRCNCIVPGGIDTELWRNWVQRMADEQGVDFESHRARMLQGVALRDISSPRTSPTSRCSWPATRAARSPDSRSPSTPVATCRAEAPRSRDLVRPRCGRRQDDDPSSPDWRAMPDSEIEVNGGIVVYEFVGPDDGEVVVITPGGRFSKDYGGVHELADALAEGGKRVLLWDRPNCGRSDVQVYGRSESHMRAETLGLMLQQLGIEQVVATGGSGGARDMIVFTIMWPDLVRKLAVWSIVGGTYSTMLLATAYVLDELGTVRKQGIEGVIEMDTGPFSWAAMIRRTPATRNACRDRKRGVRAGDEPLVGRVRPEAERGHPRRARLGVRDDQVPDVGHARWREGLRPPEAHVVRGARVDRGIAVDRAAVARGRVGACGGGDRSRDGEPLRSLGAGGARPARLHRRALTSPRRAAQPSGRDSSAWTVSIVSASSAVLSSR